MPRLLDRSPLPPRPSEVVVLGERVRLRANQIIVWITLTRPRLKEPNPAALPFPAIPDTGHTHTFSIQHRHLAEWAGIGPDGLPPVGHVRERGHRIQLRLANIWVHPNVPRSRDRLADRPPHPVGADRGIAIHPAGVEFPRLPILGLRAVADNDLVLLVNGHHKETTLRTAFRWWPVAGR